MYLFNKPVLGFLVGALSSGKLLSIKTSENTIPSFLKASIILFCAGQNVSSGKELVPKPSWLLTITNS